MLPSGEKFRRQAGRAILFALALIPLLPSLAPAQQRPEYGRVPLAFEANTGQTDARVKFVSRGEGYALFLTASEAVLALHSPHDRGAALRMTVIGANARPVITPEQQLPGKSNYITGTDRRQWRTGVPNYTRVKYASVYPGIDLVYYGNQRQLEYDFIVAPGADPASIAVRFEGADSSRLDAGGDLVLAIGGEEVMQHRPVVYQEMSGRRVTVDARYVLKVDGRIAFDVAAYDRSLPLVIDPVLRYSTFIGAHNDFGSLSFAAGVAADSSGSAYVVGTTPALEFPTTAGAFQPSAIRLRDENPTSEMAFVTKFNATGTAQIYSTYFGTGVTQGHKIAVDDLGQAYFLGKVFQFPGETVQTSIPIVNGFRTLYGGEFSRGFIAKLDSTGSNLLYSSYIDSEWPTSIAVDNAGHAYVGGVGGETPTAGAFSANGNAWVMKIDTLASGAASLNYSTRLGGEVINHFNFPRPGDPFLPIAVAVDASDHLYVAGTAAPFEGAGGWPTTPGAFDSTYNDLSPEHAGDIFVMKLNPAGSGVVYFTFVGSGFWDAASGIAVDSAGNAYVAGMTGIFAGHDTQTPPLAGFPTTPGAYRTAPYPGDAYAQMHGVVFKLNAAGSALIYSTHLGGNAFDYVAGITIDVAGRASVAGSTSSHNFPVTPDALQATHAGGGSERRGDIFVTTLSADGSTLEYSTFFGGSTQDFGAGIAGDSNGNLFVVGRTPTFEGTVPPPITQGAFSTTYSDEGILFKLGGPAPALTLNAAAVTVAEGQTAANAGTFADADSPSLMFTASTGAVVTGSGTWNWSMPGPDGPATEHVVVTVDDGDGSFPTTTEFDVSIANVAPVAATSGPTQPVATRAAFTLNGNWTDPATTLDAPYTWTWMPLTPATDGAGNPLQATSGSSAYGASIPYNADIVAPGTYQFKFSVTDKDGGSHDSTVSVTVAIKPTFVAYATNSVEVKAFARVAGDIGAPAAATGKTLTERGVEVGIGLFASVAPGSAVYADSLLVRTRSSVPLAFFNQLIDRGSGNVVTEVTPLPGGIVAPTLPNFAGAAGTQDVWIDGSRSDCKKANTKCVASGATLVPGAYGDLRSSSGSSHQPNVLNLTPGTYTFESIDLGPSTQLRAVGATGTVRVYVAKQMDTDINSYIGPAPGSSLTAKNIIFHVGGINGKNGKLHSNPKSVQIGVANRVFANFYAPAGTIWLREGTVAVGAFVARDIEVGLLVSLTLDSAFQ